MYSNGGIYIPDRKPPMGAVRNPYLKINREIVGDWMMWEEAGLTVEDLSGNNNTGALVADTHFAPGKFGSVLDFDGDLDLVDIPDNYDLHVGPNYSVSIWFNARASSGWKSIWNDELSVKGASISVRNGNLDYVIGTGAAARTGNIITSISLNTWYHVVGVYTDVGTFYVNGQLVKIVAETITKQTSDNTIRFGYGAGGSYRGYFNGLIDLPTIYNRILSAGEAAKLYQEPFCGFRWPSIEQLAVYYEGIGGEDFLRTITDGVGIADSMDRVQVLSRTITDGVGTADSIGRTQEQVRTLAETLGLTDSLWKAETKIFVDAVGIADAITKTQAFARTIADDVGLVDSESELMTHVRTLAETLEITDAMSKTVGFPRTISDDIGITDSVTRTAVFARIVAEAMGIEDVVTKTQVQLRTIADTMGLTDAMTPGQLIIFAEAMGITDAMTHTKTQIRVIADSLGITDDLTRIANYVFTQADDIGIGDAMIRVAVALRTISDDVGMTDTMSSISELVKAAWAFMLLKKSN